MISGNKCFKKNGKNIYQKLNNTDFNHTIDKNRTSTIPLNLKYKFNQNVYIRMDPENLEKNYKSIEPNETIYNNKNKTKIYNSINYSNNKSLFIKKSFYSKKSKDNSLMETSTNNLSFTNNKKNNYNNEHNIINTFKINNKNEYSNMNNGRIREFPKNKEKNKNTLFIHNRAKNKRNYSIKIVPYINKTLEYKINHEDNSFKKNDNNSKINQNLKINDLPTLNIYQIKLVTIFVQIINKIVLKHKKIFIIIFFENLKINENKKYIVDSNYKKINSKYSKYKKYKDINSNYVNNNNNLSKGKIIKKSKGKDELIINDSSSIDNNRKNPKQRNNQILISKKTFNKNYMRRLNELSEKYEKIYEKKKSISISFNKNNNFLKRINTDLNKSKRSIDINNSSNIDNLSKNKNNDSFNNQNNANTLLKERMLFKKKFFISELSRNKNTIMNRPELSKTNTTEEFNRSFPFKNIGDFYISFNNKEKEDLFNSYREEFQKKIDNKIITKKLKITPRLSKDFKRQKSFNSIDNMHENKNDINIEKGLFKAHNIKNIITSDKRIYVHISYIPLLNQNNYKKDKYYNNFILRISNKFNIQYLTEKKKNKKIIHRKKLSLIKEEPYNINHYSNSKNEEYESDNKKYNKEKGTISIDKYKINYKKILNKNMDRISLTEMSTKNNRKNIIINNFKKYEKQNKRYVTLNNEDKKY